MDENGSSFAESQGFLLPKLLQQKVGFDGRKIWTQPLQKGNQRGFGQQICINMSIHFNNFQLICLFNEENHAMLKHDVTF